MLTGGGTAGHFYPLIAIAEAVNKIVDSEKLVKADLYYMSTSAFDQKVLFDNDISFRLVFSGKARLYFSFLNFVDMFKIVIGIIKGLWSVYLLYPDVVISKGGYGSIPAVFAARVLRIPVIVHESDSVPGRANMWASKFAEKVAVSWPEAAHFFPAERVAVTGQPVRTEIQYPVSHGAFEYLHLEENVPVIFIIGGSQGAQKINETVLDVLPKLLEKYQIIHQTGAKNFEEVERTARIILEKHANKVRYKPFGYLNNLAMKMAAGATTLVISRAGSTIFEIAAWGVPSIIIPLTDSQGDHQRKNAFNYSRTGACIVIEEYNLSPNILAAEVDRLMGNDALRKQMGDRAKTFFKPDAGEKIARQAIEIALRHE